MALIDKLKPKAGAPSVINSPKDLVGARTAVASAAESVSPRTTQSRTVSPLPLPEKRRGRSPGFDKIRAMCPALTE
jgi:hypothetical protein